MNHNIGIENKVFVLDARPAFAPASAASGAPDITFFWFGHIINQTLRNINVPNTAPKIILIFIAILK